jgi:hypothetical protein
MAFDGITEISWDKHISVERGLLTLHHGQLRADVVEVHTFEQTRNEWRTRSG